MGRACVPTAASAWHEASALNSRVTAKEARASSRLASGSARNQRLYTVGSFPPWDGGPQSFGYSYLLSE